MKSSYIIFYTLGDTMKIQSTKINIFKILGNGHFHVTVVWTTGTISSIGRLLEWKSLVSKQNVI